MKGETIARAWAVTRRDGLVLGFTDHDRMLAFGGITTSSVDYRKGHAMMRYVTVNKKEFDFLRRQAYPSVRHGFRPAAYVVLTRVFGHVTEEVHG